MKIFKSFKQNRNQVEFSKEDYVVLDYEQLLKINGAKGDSGNSVENSHEGVAKAKPGDILIRKNGEKVVLSQVDIDYAKKQIGSTNSIPEVNNTGSNDSTSETSNTGSTNSIPEVNNTGSNDSTPETSNTGSTNSIPEVNKTGSNDSTPENGNIGSIGSNNTSLDNSRDSGRDKTANSNDGKASSYEENKGNNTTHRFDDPKGIIANPLSSPTGALTATQKIENAIESIGNKVYEKRFGGYMCDNYVEDIITKAGYNAKDFYVDDPIGKTVDVHIKELEESANGVKSKYQTDISQLESGSYVVFMQDKEKNIDGITLGSHAAILVINSDGSAYMQDNSSGNMTTITDSLGNSRAVKGGTERTFASSIPGGLSGAELVKDLYSEKYDNWYFQKIQ